MLAPKLALNQHSGSKGPETEGRPLLLRIFPVLGRTDMAEIMKNFVVISFMIFSAEVFHDKIWVQFLVIFVVLSAIGMSALSSATAECRQDKKHNVNYWCNDNPDFYSERDAEIKSEMCRRTGMQHIWRGMTLPCPGTRKKQNYTGFVFSALLLIISIMFFTSCVGILCGVWFAVLISGIMFHDFWRISNGNDYLEAFEKILDKK